MEKMERCICEYGRCFETTYKLIDNEILKHNELIFLIDLLKGVKEKPKSKVFGYCRNSLTLLEYNKMQDKLNKFLELVK